MAKTLISPKEASEKGWLVEVYSGVDWQLGLFYLSNAAINYWVLTNGRWETKGVTDNLEIVPVFTHTRMRYQEAKAVLARLAFTVFDSCEQLNSLTVGKLQESPALDHYQTLNSAVPLLLQLAVLEGERSNLMAALQGTIENVEELLLLAIPNLPIKCCKGTLDWTWPGVVEALRLVLSVVGKYDSNVREKGETLGKLITRKVLEVDKSAFRYGDLSEYFLLFGTYLSASQREEIGPVLSLALSLSPNSYFEEEKSIQESLCSLFSLLDSEFSHFLVPWGRLFAAVNWTKWPNPLINTLSTALKHSAELGSCLYESGIVSNLLEIVDFADTKALLGLIKDNPSPIYSTFFASLPPEEGNLCSIRDEYILRSIENHMWAEVHTMVSSGLLSSKYGLEAGRQSLLLTLAVGRSMPVSLLLAFFDSREITDLGVFLLISSRYTALDQAYLLSRFISRQDVLPLLAKDEVTQSSLFHNQNVQTMLRNVLFRDRFSLLWLHSKAHWTHRIPLGLLRSVVVSYL